MLLRSEDQFHVGIVVHELGETRDWLTDTFGYEWDIELQTEYTMQLPQGPLTYQQHLQYSVTEPRLELVESVESTPFQPSSSGLHHFGYWCADVQFASAELAQSGWRWECGGNLEDGSPAWAYHFNQLGVRVELVSLELRSIGMEALWAPTNK